MSEIDWSKAPEGATHATPKGHNYYADFWRIVQGTATDAWVVLPDGDFYHVLLPALFERDRKELVERPSSPAWNGEGLPPVGTVCEMQDDIGNWIPVEIIAVHAGYAHGWSEQSELAYFSNLACEFRPIRTPEQIAAEAREKAIKAIGNLLASYGPTFRDQATALYDAGYRKTEG